MLIFLRWPYLSQSNKSAMPTLLPTSAPTPHVTTALDHALCFSPACRLSDFVGSLNGELEMGATCTVGEGQCA